MAPGPKATFNWRNFTCKEDVFDANGVPFYHKVTVYLGDEDLKHLATLGVHVRNDVRYTTHEDDIILKNWFKIAKQYNLPLNQGSDYAMISQKLPREERIYRRNLRIPEKLAVGLPLRTAFSVRNRAKRILADIRLVQEAARRFNAIKSDEHLKADDALALREAPFTEEEDKLLITTVENMEAGEAISERFGRPRCNVRDRYRWLMADKDLGIKTFTKHEDYKLIELVRAQTSEEGDTTWNPSEVDTDSVDWETIGKQMHKQKKRVLQRWLYIVVHCNGNLVPKKKIRWVYTDEERRWKWFMNVNSAAYFRRLFMIKCLRRLRYEYEWDIKWPEVVTSAKQYNALHRYTFDYTGKKIKELWYSTRKFFFERFTDIPARDRKQMPLRYKLRFMARVINHNILNLYVHRKKAKRRVKVCPKLDRIGADCVDDMQSDTGSDNTSGDRELQPSTNLQHMKYELQSDTGSENTSGDRQLSPSNNLEHIKSEF